MKITKTTCRKHHTLCNGKLKVAFNASNELVQRVNQNSYGQYDEHMHKLILSSTEALELYQYLEQNKHRLGVQEMNEKQRDTLRIYMAMFDKLVVLAVEKDGMTAPEAIKAVKSALVEGVK